MSEFRWILVGLAILVWIGTYAIYFNRDFQRWRRDRPRRQAEAAATAKRREEERARLADELASKYPLPSSPMPSPQPPQRP